MRFIPSTSNRSSSWACTFAAGLLLVAAGCASRTGFDREAMRAVLHADPHVTGERPPSSDPATTTTPALPFKLGLFFVEREVPRRHGIYNIQWLSADKDALVLWLKSLRDERILNELFLLADPTIQGRDVRKIRQRAARYGMDAVLIVDGIGAVDRFTNGYAAFYPTLIGAYLAPGTECESLVTVEGSLWDIRSERLYVTQTVDGTWKAVGPAMSVEDRDVLAKAKHSAFEEFGSRITEQLRRMKPERRASPDR